MRKGILILLIIGIVALIGVGDAIAVTWESIENPDIYGEDMNRGNDYTRTWKEQGYSAWIGTSKFGGWFWAAQFIAPCPQWEKTPDHYGGHCRDWDVAGGYTPEEDPQTQYGIDSDLHEDSLYIVDDLYARVVDHWINDVTENKGILDQDLDILFATYPDAYGNRHVVYEDGDPHTLNTLIDQSIDQQFAYWDDVDGDNYIDIHTEDGENGITQRLVAEFGLSLRFSGPNIGTGVTTGLYMKEAEWVDQWVVQWIRDIDTVDSIMDGGKQGIDQLLSSWFMWGDEAYTCTVCRHTYELDHDEVKKVVVKDTHDHNPLDEVKYGSTGTTDVKWDP